MSDLSSSCRGVSLNIHEPQSDSYSGSGTWHRWHWAALQARCGNDGLVVIRLPAQTVLQQSWFVLEVGLHCQGNVKLDRSSSEVKGGKRAKQSEIMGSLPAYSWGSIGLLTTVCNAAIQSFWSSSVSQVNRNFLSGVTMVIPNCQWLPRMFGGRPASTV